MTILIFSLRYNLVHLVTDFLSTYPQSEIDNLLVDTYFVDEFTWVILDLTKQSNPHAEIALPEALVQFKKALAPTDSTSPTQAEATNEIWKMLVNTHSPESQLAATLTRHWLEALAQDLNLLPKKTITYRRENLNPTFTLSISSLNCLL